jgi:uncharacterized Rmd1/YagE family protein
MMPSKAYPAAVASLTTRFFSSSSNSVNNINVSHISAHDANSFTGTHSALNSQSQSIPVPPAPTAGIPISIKAYYIARDIDVLAIPNFTSYKSSRRVQQAKSVTITLNEELNQYISIFQYGSVVFFNVPEPTHSEHLSRIASQASVQDAIIPPALPPTDSYKVIVHQNLDNPSVIKAEHLNIQRLDMKNIEIVGTIIAESVALDYYSTTVDALLNQFILMNHKIQRTGDFAGLSAQALHQLVASNNIIITNVLSKMGLFEGTDAAWDNADYHYTWEALRKDFEIDYRFKDLSQKLQIIKDDTRFFLEVLHNKKSTRIELIIVLLIAGEMLIGFAGLGMQYLG